MFPEHVKSLRQLLEAFPTEKACLEFIEWRRWRGNVTSPFVEKGKAWRCGNGKYMCAKTRKYFTGRTGSIFEKTKIPLRDWFIAAFHMNSYKKGISSTHLARELGITQCSAWHLAQKLRSFFGIPQEEKPMVGVFEMDEAVFGGSNLNRHKDKKFPHGKGGHSPDKTWVFGILQRGGPLRVWAIDRREGDLVQAIVRKVISPGSVIITDAWKPYRGLAHEYLHYQVKDGEKIGRYYDPKIHTNSIEGAWAPFKRGYSGIYNWWSKKYLGNYIAEFAFRHNTRKMNDWDRFLLFLDNVYRRVTRADLTRNEWISSLSQ
jgi:hypothetical protein